MLIKKRLSSVITTMGILSFVFATTASAHVVVKPAEVVTAGFQTFTMGVPVEKDIPTVSLKLVIPSGLKYVSPTQKAGWQISIEKDGTGEDATVKSITWTGGSIDPGFRDDFTFSAQAPAKATSLQWKAYQTYSDGTVVSWDQKPNPANSDDDSITPYSVTSVVSESAADSSVKTVSQAASDAKNQANLGTYVGGAGLIVALVAIYFATRKN